MTQDQIQLPGPDAYRIFDGEGDYDYRDDLPDEQSIAWSARYGRKWEGVYTATTVRRLIAEAVEKEREACALACESRAPCNGRMDEWDAAAMTCAAGIRARSAAKSAGELQAVDRSPETAAHPGLHALDDAARAGGMACDRLPERVPPAGLEREGELSTQDHQSMRGDIAGGTGVFGGLEGERSADGGLAEGVST